MPVQKIGNPLTTPAERPESPVITRSEAGDIVSRTYSIKKSQVKTYTDGLSYGTADSEYSAAKLREMFVEGITGDTSLLRLVFKPNSFTYESLPPTGTVIQEIDANPIEIPISQNGEASAAQQENLRLQGVEAFLDPQPIYRRIEILSSFTFSEANAIDNVGKIDNTPEGLTSPSAGKWLKTGLHVRQVGDKYEQTETWQYARNGWNTDLYASVA